MPWSIHSFAHIVLSSTNNEKNVFPDLPEILKRTLQFSRHNIHIMIALPGLKLQPQKHVVRRNENMSRSKKQGVLLRWKWNSFHGRNAICHRQIPLLSLKELNNYFLCTKSKTAHIDISIL